MGKESYLDYSGAGRPRDTGKKANDWRTLQYAPLQPHLGNLTAAWFPKLSPVSMVCRC